MLNKLPKKQQPQAKAALWQIYRAKAKNEAHQAFNHFLKTSEAKYPEAVECLVKDNALLASYDFPAEHWQHIRSTNPIESTFHRTAEN